MYISKIQINNFRNFKEKEIEFNDGVNVIIGPLEVEIITIVILLLFLNLNVLKEKHIKRMMIR